MLNFLGFSLCFS